MFLVKHILPIISNSVFLYLMHVVASNAVMSDGKISDRKPQLELNIIRPLVSS
jgi:hypothetical protein